MSLLTVSCNCSDSVNSNKDPVCETELHFTEKYQIVSKSFEIQFTPPLVFQPKQFPIGPKAQSENTGMEACKGNPNFFAKVFSKRRRNAITEVAAAAALIGVNPDAAEVAVVGTVGVAVVGVCETSVVGAVELQRGTELVGAGWRCILG